MIYFKKVIYSNLEHAKQIQVINFWQSTYQVLQVLTLLQDI